MEDMRIEEVGPIWHFALAVWELLASEATRLSLDRSFTTSTSASLAAGRGGFFIFTGSRSRVGSYTSD